MCFLGEMDLRVQRESNGSGSESLEVHRRLKEAFVPAIPTQVVRSAADAAEADRSLTCPCLVSNPFFFPIVNGPPNAFGQSLFR